MPNIRGGKAYKKLKGASHNDEEVEFIDKQSDQLIGRLVRLLGNRNTSVYCEDNKTRICRITTGIKRTKFDVGDVVLLSLRDCEVAKADLDKGIRSDRGDIIAKYHPQQYDQLKKDGINANLFIQIDTVNAMATRVQEGDMKGAEQLAAADNDDFFDTSGRGETAEDDEIDIDAI
jgi:initiation factor 1A